jgi:hypothetical protein
MAARYELELLRRRLPLAARLRPPDELLRPPDELLRPLEVPRLRPLEEERPRLLPELSLLPLDDERLREELERPEDDDDFCLTSPSSISPRQAPVSSSCMRT